MSQCLPCCVESTAEFRPKAQYALQMLLFPLGIDPKWVVRNELTGVGIYYGSAPDGLPHSIISLRLTRETEEYFQYGSAYPPAAVRWVEWDGASWPVLFMGGDQPDLVASTFFWLSNWQETTCATRDRHGRFPFEASLQSALGIATRPAVDAYRERIAALLAENGIQSRPRSFGQRAWALCPTHDIDYLRKWRPGILFRETVQYPLLNYRKVTVGQRAKRFARFLRQFLHPGDPYRNAIKRLFRETRQRRGTATFFLKASAHGPNDVAYRVNDPFLVRQRSEWENAGFEVGLHTSYHAHTHPDYIECEAAELGSPASVRQHFLRYDLPITPRLQERAGLRIDSTLGFAETVGFRNATCLPFLRFDVPQNRVTSVWEMPLAVMESTLFNRIGLPLEAAVKETEQLLFTCQQFGGVAVMLWHGVLWDELDHSGWGDHFMRTLDFAVREGALIASLNDALSVWLKGAPYEAAVSCGELQKL